MKEAFERYMADYRATLSPRTAQIYADLFAKFFAWCEGEGLNLRKIQREHIAAWMSWRRVKLGHNGAWINGSLCHLKKFFEWCVEERLVKANPVQLRHLPRFQVEDVEKIPFDEAQYRRVLHVIEQGEFAPCWKSLCVISWHTGLRLSDACLLRWQSVHFDDRKLVVHPKKRRARNQRLEIPMSAELYEHLLTIRNTGGIEDFVLPEAERLYMRGVSGLGRTFRRICDCAGLPDHSFHSWRHGFVTRLINAGVDSLVIASMTGQTLEVIQGYAHVSMQAKRNALGAGGLVEERQVALAAPFIRASVL